MAPKVLSSELKHLKCTHAVEIVADIGPLSVIPGN